MQVARGTRRHHDVRVLRETARTELGDPVRVAGAELAFEDAQKVGHVLEGKHLERRRQRDAMEDAIQSGLRLVGIALGVEAGVLCADWRDGEHVGRFRVRQPLP